MIRPIRHPPHRPSAALDAAATGDAEAWFDAIAAHGDATRICGYSALYALLRAAAPGPGTLLRYEQSVEAGGSVVTCAAMAWGAGHVAVTGSALGDAAVRLLSARLAWAVGGLLFASWVYKLVTWDG